MSISISLLAPVALKLAPAIANGILKKWLGDGTKTDLAKEVVDALKGVGDKALKSWEEGRQIAAIGERVASEMLPLFQNEFPSLDADSRAAVAREFITTLALAQITDQVLVAANLDPQAIARHLRATRPHATRDLTADQEALYLRLVDEVSKDIVKVGAEISGFASSAWADTFQMQERILTNLVTLVSRPSAEEARFEALYRSTLARQLDRMELFGLPRMDALAKQQSLSVAYVTLQAEQFGTDRDKQPNEFEKLIHQLGVVSVQAPRAERP